MADLTLSDSAISIEQNSWFRARVRSATSKYANYLLNTPTDDPIYSDKIAAGLRISQSADMVVNQLMFTMAGDAEVIAAGPGVPDATLQTIVEKTIQKFWPVTPAPAAMAYYPPGYQAPPPPPPVTQ